MQGRGGLEARGGPAARAAPWAGWEAEEETGAASPPEDREDPGETPPGAASSTAPATGSAPTREYPTKKPLPRQLPAPCHVSPRVTSCHHVTRGPGTCVTTPGAGREPQAVRAPQGAFCLRRWPTQIGPSQKKRKFLPPCCCGLAPGLAPGPADQPLCFLRPDVVLLGGHATLLSLT